MLKTALAHGKSTMRVRVIDNYFLLKYTFWKKQRICLSRTGDLNPWGVGTKLTASCLEWNLPDWQSGQRPTVSPDRGHSGRMPGLSGQGLCQQTVRKEPSEPMGFSSQLSWGR